MIDRNDLFVGDIKKCVRLREHIVNGTGEKSAGYIEQEDEVAFYNATLVKTKSDRYVDINNIYMMEAIRLKILPASAWLKMNKVIMDVVPSAEGDYFVDVQTLRPYDKDDKDKVLKKIIS